MLPKHLNFVTFKVRSLNDRGRQIELSNTLHYNKIDIAFVQECHLRGYTHIFIDGYNFFYDKSPLGVAILLKNTISFKRVFIDVSQFNATFLQTEIKINSSIKKFLVGSIYVPTNLTRDALGIGLNSILEAVRSYDSINLGGDFNSKNTSCKLCKH